MSCSGLLPVLFGACRNRSIENTKQVRSKQEANREKPGLLPETAGAIIILRAYH